MPAPNVAYLLDLESPYEDVLRNYFANVNVGGSTFYQVVTPRTGLTDAEFLKTPRLQIRVGVGPVMPAGGGIKQDTYLFNGQQVNYWSAFMLNLELTVATQRNNSQQNHGQLRGMVRQGMLQATAIMNSNVLPYYQTEEVVPLTATQGIFPENDEIQTQLTYELSVSINPNAFPNS